ncbi:MAG: helix-turn-helix transcriptional regulator [Thalassotalea sp.]|nr:helix-turn-helix transcriptional regulator [Thalassotalea sp.]
MKTLRQERQWSQEQLAQLSGLNVRTIQRFEKGEGVGLETLKSLAAVFEITTEELLESINGDVPNNAEQSFETEESHEKKQAIEKVKSIKYFYALTGFLIGIFLLFMLPNYNGGENLGSLIVVFLSFAAIIGCHALSVFLPFGNEWESKKVSEIIDKQKANKKYGLKVKVNLKS